MPAGVASGPVVGQNQVVAKRVAISGARRVKVREVGQWRRLRRTAALAGLLLIVELPLVHAVSAGDPAGADYPGMTCVVPMRLALLVDALFIYMYVPTAWRVLTYVRGRRPTETVLTTTALVGAVLVSAAAVFDVVEGVVLWNRFAPPLPIGTGTCPDTSVAVVGVVLDVLWSTGFGLCLLAFCCSLGPVYVRLERRLDRASRALRRWGRRRRRPRVVAPEGASSPLDAQGREGGTVICCSGGGIRSAAFSLGVLQVLSEKGIYQRASAVVGVSGGAYLAAAFHTVRRSLRPGDPPPFAFGTPELARIRRQTRYLLPSVAVGARGVMSLVFGVLVNLTLAAVLLRGVSWLLGWLIHEVGLLQDWDTPSVRADFSGLPWWYWTAAVGPLAVLVGLFLADVVLDRFRPLPTVLRQEGRALAQWATVPALLVAALLLGVPWALAEINAIVAVHGLPGDLVHTIAVWLEQILSTELGVAVGGGLGAALLALARSAWKGFTDADHAETIGSPVAKAAAWARTRLVPWLGTVLVVAVGLVVLLGWTMNYAVSIAWRSDWRVAGICVLLALVIRVCTDATRTSLHPYYREQLAHAYLVRRDGGDAVAFEYGEPMPYSQWAAAPDGGPELVLVGSANAFDHDFVPADRNCVPFIFDPHRTGVAGDESLPPQGMVRTAAYERRADYRRRDVTLPAAMAISRAAFSPLTGRDYFRTRPMRLLFAMVNARLGVWLPNPYWGTTSRSASLAERSREAAERRGGLAHLWAWATSAWALIVSLADKPGPYRLFKEAFGTTSLYDRRLYITDGGHYDVLGLVEALRRRPERIIVIDASNDRQDAFTRVGMAIATAAMDLGVRIDIDLDALRQDDDGRSCRAWARGIARYPDGSTSEVYVLKALLVEDLPWDIEAYAARNPDFPRRTTGDQLYGEFDFEAYRSLGHHLATDLASALEEAERPRAAAAEEHPDEGSDDIGDVHGRAAG